MSRISVFGLGKLGFPMAAYFASRGFSVIGVDVNEDIVKSINERKSPFHEEGVQQLLDSFIEGLEATTDYKRAIESTDISFIFVGTPNLEDGAFSMKYVNEVGTQIGEALKDKKYYHLLVLRSTVLPGETENLIKIIEKKSGKKCGEDFGMCHSPEFLALGKVVKDLSEPEFLLIGEHDKKSGDMLEHFYKQTVVNSAPIVRTNLVNAEIGKLMLNNYVTMKMDFANFMSEMCEKIPGANVSDVSDILGHDTRIGRKFLNGGMAYGGTCFPRDNKALIQYISKLNMNMNLPHTIEEINNNQTMRLIVYILENIFMPKDKTISILGMTFKPSTNIIEESASVKLAKSLKLHSINTRIKLHDPSGLEKTKEELGKGYEYCDTVEECLKDSDLAIVAVPWDEYIKLEPIVFLDNMKSPEVLDCWRLYKKERFGDEVKYHALGVSEL